MITITIPNGLKPQVLIQSRPNEHLKSVIGVAAGDCATILQAIANDEATVGLIEALSSLAGLTKSAAAAAAISTEPAGVTGEADILKTAEEGAPASGAAVETAPASVPETSGEQAPSNSDGKESVTETAPPEEKVEEKVEEAVA